jgi:hypothetical protein
MDQGKIFGLEVMNISKKLGFRMVRVKHRMGKEGAGPLEAGRNLNVDRFEV